jgi:hypothetical protein
MQRYVTKKNSTIFGLIRSLAIVLRHVKRARKAKKGDERDGPRRPFNFTAKRTLPPQTELEQRIFDKMWNVRFGWDWKETDQGKFFFDNKGGSVGERELSKAHTDQFGRAGPLSTNFREAMEIYNFMKEPEP